MGQDTWMLETPPIAVDRNHGPLIVRLEMGGRVIALMPIHAEDQAYVQGVVVRGTERARHVPHRNITFTPWESVEQIASWVARGGSDSQLAAIADGILEQRWDVAKLDPVDVRPIVMTMPALHTQNTKLRVALAEALDIAKSRIRDRGHGPLAHDYERVLDLEKLLAQ